MHTHLFFGYMEHGLAALMMCCKQNCQKLCPGADAIQALGTLWLNVRSSVIAASTRLSPFTSPSKGCSTSKSRSAYRPAQHLAAQKGSLVLNGLVTSWKPEQMKTRTCLPDKQTSIGALNDSSLPVCQSHMPTVLLAGHHVGVAARAFLCLASKLRGQQGQD